MFSYFDLVFPIGTATLASFFCMWAAIKADAAKDPKAARYISIATMIVFLLAVPGVYGMRYASSRCDWISARGMRVTQGKVNRCEQNTVQKWEDDLVNFWVKTLPPDQVSMALSGKHLVCKDEEKISLSTTERFFRGYSTDSTAVIGWIDLTYTKSLYRHEVSHLILTYCGTPYDETIQHQKMKEASLGD